MTLDDSVDLTDRRPTVVVNLKGDIDELSERQVLLAVEEALAFEPRRLELDLYGVTVLGSCGLSILLLARQLAAQHHAAVTVVNAPPIVRRVMEIAALDEVFGMAP